MAQDGSGTAVLSDVSSMSQVTRGEPVFDWSNTDFRVRETLRTANVEPDGEMSIGTNEKPYSTGYFNQIYIGGNPVSVIEEEGTSGSWYYRKWNSGIAECWCAVDDTVTYEGAAFGGYLYYTGLYIYPLNFISVPTVSYNATFTSGYTAIIGDQGTIDTSSFGRVRILSNIGGLQGASVLVRIHAIGRWK